MSPLIRQIPENAFSGPALTEGAGLFRTPESLVTVHAIEWESYWEDGLGPARIAVFETTDGTLFSLQHLERASRKDLMTIYVRPGDIGLHVDAVLIALGLTSADLAWLADGARLRPTRLVRQDDNGVRFHMGDYPCRADAEAIITRLTAGVHKQAYFIESIVGRGPTLRFSDDFRSPPSVLPA